MKISGRTVLVAGAGISGKNAARMLLSMGREVILFDGKENLDCAAVKNEIGVDGDLSFCLGELTDEVIRKADYCVVSPGISLESEPVVKIKQAGLPMIGEVELAYLHARGRLAAVTGTNGKTTTTALCGKILSDYYGSVFVVGNIGNAYTSEALKTTADSITVAEVSSFQLETIDLFHPQVSAILNITPDHLNRHKTMEMYAETKENVCRNQTKEDICVLNYEDEILRTWAPACPAAVRFFSSGRALDSGAFLEDGEIILAEEGKRTVICGVHEMKLLGRHNVENVCAAILIADSLDVPVESIRRSVRAFEAVEHRIEFVASVNGVRYYNDSKGTNTDAAIQAINAMDRPTVLIAGGYDKGSEYDEWLEACRPNTRRLILIGETAQKIGEAAKKAGIRHITYAGTLESAVHCAADSAQPGDAVLLSPACASWDMFPNYEVRGTRFKELVSELAAAPGAVVDPSP